MDAAYELASYLASNGFGTLATDIFVDQLPAEQDGIYVSSLGGTMGKYTPINETVLDIYVKDASATTGKNTINDIKNFIHRMYDTNTANAHFYSILALGDIENVGRDLEYAKLYKLTVQIINRDTSLIS